MEGRERCEHPNRHLKSHLVLHFSLARAPASLPLPSTLTRMSYCGVSHYLGYVREQPYSITPK
jgi:hypothetical protein